MWLKFSELLGLGMLPKAAVPVGRCGTDELRDRLFHAQCIPISRYIQGVPLVRAEAAWKTLQVSVPLITILLASVARWSRQ